MMLYCKKCMLPLSQSMCESCGSTDLVPILPEDPCYLTQQQVPWAGILEDVLRSRAIPYMKRSTRGAALSAQLGSFGEWFCFYVPYEYRETAGKLVEDLFTPCEEDDLTDL